MTRGRLSNDVWVVTDGVGLADPVDLLADVMQQRWGIYRRSSISHQ